jgi:cell wall-associated NlpC family hydrolase
MAAKKRLILLVLALAYSTLFGPGKALGWAGRHHFQLHPRPHARVGLSVGERAVSYARHLVGVPYRYGGDSPRTGFDCSGFVRFVYSHFGFSLPHSSYADFELGRRVARGALRPGDLVFFDGVGHVGMYIGDGRFIHAPHTGTDVQVTSLSEQWYAASYDGARRLFPAPPRRKPFVPPLRPILSQLPGF